MRRFDFDDDYEEDTDEMRDDIEYILPPEIQYIQMTQLDLLATQASQQLLAITIDMLRRSWFWRWRSVKNKVEIICETYRKLAQLTREEREE